MPDSDQISVLHVDDDADIQEIAMLALDKSKPSRRNILMARSSKTGMST